MYTATNDGGGLTKVSSQIRDYHSVYILPDGSTAVFTSKAADGYSQIYYLSPVDSTTQPVQLTTTPLHKTSAMLSADGSKIVFAQFPVQTVEFPVGCCGDGHERKQPLRDPSANGFEFELRASVILAGCQKNRLSNGRWWFWCGLVYLHHECRRKRSHKTHRRRPCWRSGWNARFRLKICYYDRLVRSSCPNT